MFPGSADCCFCHESLSTINNDQHFMVKFISGVTGLDLLHNLGVSAMLRGAV